jgi:hypothetical protein
MVKAKNVEYYDHFITEIVFWCAAEVTNEDFIGIARAIDKDDYNADCFGVCIVLDENGFEVSCHSSSDEQLYYTDVDGNKTYFNYKLTEEEIKGFTKVCANKVLELTEE